MRLKVLPAEPQEPKGGSLVPSPVHLVVPGVDQKCKRPKMDLEEQDVH
jgi:hypothetical protein